MALRKVHTANEKSLDSQKDLQSFETKGQRSGNGKWKSHRGRKTRLWTLWLFSLLLLISLYYWSTSFRMLFMPVTTTRLFQRLPSKTQVAFDHSSKVVRSPGAFALLNLDGRHLSGVGIVSTNTLFRVNQTSSVVLQFGPVNFRSEYCELKFRLPYRSPYTQQDEPFSVSIYQLDHFTPLLKGAKRSLVDSKSPARLLNFGTIDVVGGQPVEWKESFNCASGSILTFEMACATVTSGNTSRDKCLMEWLQKDPDQGFFMVQHSA